ncbi:cold-inducible protein YdjO-related protein, partial [Paenibacillus sonchi]|uniref:cold-inducible protein YdjO-related protein n=1 Tax=Paenibacillus sonchi TaxID=373687 RepID=UPI0012FD75AC
ASIAANRIPAAVRHTSASSSRGKTHTVPIWKCTGGSCPGWTRMKAGGAEDHLSSKPCPLCSSPMEKSMREVPV